MAQRYSYGTFGQLNKSAKYTKACCESSIFLIRELSLPVFRFFAFNMGLNLEIRVSVLRPEVNKGEDNSQRTKDGGMKR